MAFYSHIRFNKHIFFILFYKFWYITTTIKKVCSFFIFIKVFIYYATSKMIIINYRKHKKSFFIIH
ncbi:hypothetical protein AMV182 [Betaentomopoxvirus amoorei]|uniref:AMV182 n=1 Tax=Amsacta moorei entomopoxvirus TaxID=28321 RepID=Q9EMM0_AMEPV|nr:hypothetical protein AMV182 [Amsacta moorei entomopoxvirus]AAG02888.1 AMV182 [Amsacta moorei entomopoxvirus]